jgi:hypothetical protein
MQISQKIFHKSDRFIRVDGNSSYVQIIGKIIQAFKLESTPGKIVFGRDMKVSIQLIANWEFIKHGNNKS